MKKTFLRFVSTALAVIMLFGCVNVGVFAADTAEKQNTVTLTTQMPSVTTQEKDGVDAGVSVKAITRNKTLASIIAGSKIDLTAQEKAVLNAVALKSEALTYTEPGLTADEFVTMDITDVANTYTVSASAIDSGLANKWMPVGGRAVCEGGTVAFALVDGNGTFTAEKIDHVEIDYELVVSEISAETATTVANLPATLAAEAVAQKEILDFYAADGRYAQLVDFATYIPLLNVFKASFNEASQASIDKLVGECIYKDADGEHLYFADYIEQYRAKGLAFYYAEGNYEKFKTQLDELKDALNVLCADPKFDQIFEAVAGLKPELAGKQDRIREIRDDLNENPLVPVNTSIDRASAYLSVLAAAVENAIGNSAEHAVSEVVLAKTVSVVAPDKTTLNITVSVTNKDSEIIDTISASMTFDINTLVDEVVAAKIAEMIATMEAELGIDSEAYTCTSVEDDIPVAGDVIASKLAVSLVWSPMSYVIVVAGNEQVLYADGSGLSIILPGTGTPDERYVYTIGDDEISVGAENKEYTFADIASLKALCGVEGKLVVSRRTFNAAREKILAFVDAMNKAMASEATVNVGGKKVPVIAFIPVEDETGAISIVLRVTPYLQGVDYQQLVLNVMNVLLQGENPYSTLAINGENLFAGKRLYMQTVIDTVLSDGFGLDAICDMINAKGQIADITTTDAAFANVNVIATAYPIAMTNELGGKLIAAELKADTNTYPFYITFEDYGQMSARLIEVENLIAQIKEYVAITAENGVLNIEFTVPANYTAYYYAEALAFGQADLSDIENMELEEALNFITSIIKPLVADEEFTLEVLKNTLAKAGKGSGALNKISATDFARVRKVLNHLFTEGVVESEAFGNYYGATASYKIREILKTRFKVDEIFLDAIVEAGAESNGISFSFTITDSTAEAHDFDALVIDPSAGGMEMLKVTADLASVLKNAKANTVVVLLKDVTLSSDVVIPARTFINLNGYTITGNMTATGSVRITNSSLTACGGVNGDLSGNFVITGGDYTDDVSAMIKTGYVIDDGCVENAFFSISENEEGDVIVALNPAFLNADNIPTAKADLQELLVDVAFDLALNSFTAPAVAIADENAENLDDAHLLYSIELGDVLSYIKASKEEIAADLIDMVCLDEISALANEILAALADFATAADRIENDEAIIAYSILSAKWDASPEIVGGANKYITLNLAPSDEIENIRALEIRLDPDATDAEKDKVVALFKSLANTVTFNDIEVNINSIDFVGTKPVVNMTGVADVTVDLSEDARYAALIVAAAAYVSADKRDAFVDAINDYFDGSIEALVAALDSMTSAEAIAALNAISATTCEEMLAEIGVEANSLVELETVYADLLNVAGKVVGALGVKGGKTTLANYKEDGSMASYVFARENVKGFDVAFALIVLTEETPVKAEISTPAIDTTNENIVAGALVKDGVVYIDANYAGISAEQLLDLVSVETKHVSSLEMSIVKGANAKSSELVCTGDILKFSANDGDLVVRYMIVVLGDTNCNGKTDAGDAVRMAGHYVGKDIMDAYACLASDINDNKELDAGDAVKVTGKFIYWNNYTSVLD